jgi:hypothetical protein
VEGRRKWAVDIALRNDPEAYHMMPAAQLGRKIYVLR